MDKVKAQWLQEYGGYTFASFRKMLDYCTANDKFIGFIPNGGERKYFICLGGSSRGSAVRPDSTWNSSYAQETTKGQYFIFDTEQQLYRWLMSDK